ncbi:MAG: hypothetical protein N2D54_10850, partial [Chloroflexota bacterium]
MKSKQLILILTLLAACQSDAGTQTPPVRLTLVPQAQASPIPSPTPQPVELLPTQPPDGYKVYFHPDDGLYVGDLVSIEIHAPPDQEWRNNTATIRVDFLDKQIFGPQEFRATGFADHPVATFEWILDTRGLAAGEYDFIIQIAPDGPQWRETVPILAHENLPTYALKNSWARTESNCCNLYYLVDSAAERDLKKLIAEADGYAAELDQRFEVTLESPIELVLLPRILGHGGLATEALYVSYLDRNYTGNNDSLVLLHEFIHIYDLERGGRWNAAMFSEGFAVYHAGGHFKKETLSTRAAALLDLGWYIPLPELANDFYQHQHEIGYLEVGALIEYMIERWGYEAFEDFYYALDVRSYASQLDGINHILEQ